MQKLIKNKINILLVINIITILFLLILPYFIFSGKIYAGGDDTRLFYSYPSEFLLNNSFFSWYKMSSIGINGPSQYIVPFLGFWFILSMIITDKVVLNYLALSLPLILGFLYFQKALKELLQIDKKFYIEVYLGSLFYVFSPILIINQMFVFLISIWLIALIPINVYYFLKYLRTSKFIYVIKSAVWSLIFALAVYSIPWLLGFIIPVSIGLLFISILFNRKQIFIFIKHFVIYFGFIALSQAFWLTGFVSTYLSLSQDSFASKLLSKGFIDTFTPTILSTATGNIFYPLLNLFHRQIPFDFGWKLKDVFSSFYDGILILNSGYVIIFIVGIIYFKKYLTELNRKIFIFLLISFMFSLYFFTVNIGPLKDLFLLFKYIPGFIMFRNFYDKFAPGYVLIYSSLITISLIIFTNKFKKNRNYILTIFFLLTLLNFLPVKQIVNSPLWTTNNIYKTINIPIEYFDLMKYIKHNISSTNNILSVPFGTSVYTVIKDEDSNNVYAGVSPVKIFSGVNDISGHLSFNFTKEADVVDSLITKRDYKEFNNLLFNHNINYILLTKNVPKELSTSYLYNPDLFGVQDKTFINEVTQKKIFTSKSGNYELYTAKRQNSLFNSKNLYFKKVSEVKYILYIKGLKNVQELSFMDSYHAGWKLFPQKNPSLKFCKDSFKEIDTGTTECNQELKLFEMNDLKYSILNPIFEHSHSIIKGYANGWKIDQQYIEKNLDKKFYKINEDKSIDVKLVLYFTPQNFFYLGSLITLLTFVGGFLYILKKN